MFVRFTTHVLPLGTTTRALPSICCDRSIRCFGVANTQKTAAELAETVESWRHKPKFDGGSLTEEELDKFHTDGFVIKHDLIPHDVLSEAKSSINDLTSDIAEKLKTAGHIEDDKADSPFETRLIELDKQFEHFNVLLHKHGVLPGGLQKLWGHKSLLDVASQILGTTDAIVGHPVWNIRCKTPDNLSQGQSTVPWHQDNSYLSEECWDKLQLTAWVPLVNATAENGCMQVLRGGHRKGITCEHTCCVGGTWYNDLSEEEMIETLSLDLEKDIVTCEVPYGSVLFLNNIIPHRSTENYGNGVRWSLDLRYQRDGEPNGFHGLKDSVLMRQANYTAGTEDIIEWNNFANVDRTHLQQADLNSETLAAHGVKFVDDFDTTISGPWMHRWELTHHNRHTERLPEEKDGAGFADYGIRR
eukprot:GSMAST32.ASY1.ANO1.1293.1 assembled CDS